MSTPIDEADKHSTFPLVYWGGTYSILVATLYLWGYWSPFGINILEHLGFSDVINLAAYPILSVFAFFALGVILAVVMPSDNSTTQEAGVLSGQLSFLKRNLKWFATLYLLSVFALFLFGPIQKWLALPALLAIPLTITLIDVIPRISIAKSDQAQSALIFVLITLPIFAYGRGALGSNDIISGKKYLYVLSKIQSSESKLSASPSYKLRYIGKAGNQYFLYSPESESVLITPASEAIELKKSEVR